MAKAGSLPVWYAAGKNGEPGWTFARAAKRRLAKPSGEIMLASLMT
jgi:hypothetical protein